jgi:hypothetical protein
MQKENIAMTHFSNGTVATDINAHNDNAYLTTLGYTVHHIETYRTHPPSRRQIALVKRNAANMSRDWPHTQTVMSALPSHLCAE